MLLPNAVEEAQELARKLEEDRAWLATLPPKVLTDSADSEYSRVLGVPQHLA